MTDILANTIVNIFRIRDIYGQGERDTFFKLFSIITENRPKLAQSLITYIPHYGCWRDMWILWHKHPELRKAIDSATLEQFRIDQESTQPSLLIKWLPREKSKYDADCLAPHFASLFFPFTPVKARLRKYRKTLANLNRILGTTEIKMCENTWSSINPQTVPKKLFKRSIAAFYNMKQSSDPDRIQCSENFIHSLYPGRKISLTDPPRYQPIIDAVHKYRHKALEYSSIGSTPSKGTYSKVSITKVPSPQIFT